MRTDTDTPGESTSVAGYTADVDAPADAGEARGRRSSWLPWLPWLLVALAVAVAVVATWRWQELAGHERQRAAVTAAAGDFAVALTNWDAGDGMADTRESLRAGGTETFAQDVDDLFGGTEDLAALTELGARSDGDVRDVFVQSLDGDRAEALAVVVQRLTTDEGQETNVRYARMTLSAADTGWLVDDVELLVDAAQQAAPGEARG
ncbi:hypothetical protein [Egicoccus sp. AB-alg2]|uniref:hypothetical protein n=1 Tax=Egicoccus sp. AB-alg2 TaxID=3242693 RepID=UPI00359E2AC9